MSDHICIDPDREIWAYPCPSGMGLVYYTLEGLQLPRALLHPSDLEAIAAHMRKIDMEEESPIKAIPRDDEV